MRAVSIREWLGIACVAFAVSACGGIGSSGSSGGSSGSSSQGTQNSSGSGSGDTTSTTQQAPLLFTTMTHMEGGHTDDRSSRVFLTHVDQLRFGMQLFDAYGAKMTVESEKPFATACTTWGINMMQEILDAGHGVGTHCDVGFREPLMSVADFAALLKERKDLVDGLVGAANNRHFSGGGGVNDWALGGQAAGFDFIDGIVGMHYLSMPISARPDASWSDAYIKAVTYHEQAPSDLDDRLYLYDVADATDFIADANGVITVSNGELGGLFEIAEMEAGLLHSGSHPLNTDDVDALFRIIDQVDQSRDRTRVAKLNIYLPANTFVAANESLLRYLLAGLQGYAQRGVLQLATQGEVFDVYKQYSSGASAQPQTATLSDGLYTIFSMNTHDWVFSDRSAAALDKVIDIHEAYNVPVDVWLDDQIVQEYTSVAPALLQRLSTSAVVSVSYHLRAPHPMVTGFDNVGLRSMSSSDRYSTLLQFEEYRLDLATGLPDTSTAGGYQNLKDLIGYAPLGVTHISSRFGGDELARIYGDKGAVFAAEHGRDIDFGEQSKGLTLRPEHVEIKLYEKRNTTAAQVIADALAAHTSTATTKVIGIKWHENNFYTEGTSFWPVYWTDSSKSTSQTAPYDVNASAGVIQFKSSARQQELWDLYEDAVRLVSTSGSTYRPVNLMGVKQLLGL